MHCVPFDPFYIKDWCVLAPIWSPMNIPFLGGDGYHPKLPPQVIAEIGEQVLPAYHELRVQVVERVRSFQTTTTPDKSYTYQACQPVVHIEWLSPEQLSPAGYLLSAAPSCSGAGSHHCSFYWQEMWKGIDTTEALSMDRLLKSRLSKNLCLVL